MSSSADHCPAYGQAALAAGAARRSRGFCPSIVRIAVVEVVSGIGVLVPRYSAIAAALAACNMAGALVMHLTHGQTAAAFVPFVLLVSSIAVVFLRGGIRQLASLKAG